MIAIRSSPENFNKEFSEAEREKISQAVNILAEVADEMLVIIGKNYETEDGSPKSKTTACIFCSSIYKLSVIEKLLREVKEEINSKRKRNEL